MPGMAISAFHMLLVFAGGGIGSVLRWLLSVVMLKLFGSAFPFGTLAVNIIGCCAMGLAFRLLPVAASQDAAIDWRLLLMSGVLGGFTTFSAFALDAAGLWLRQELGLAALYVVASVGFSLLGVALGLTLGAWLKT
jgi:CrcB protein